MKIPLLGNDFIWIKDNVQNTGWNTKHYCFSHPHDLYYHDVCCCTPVGQFDITTPYHQCRDSHYKDESFNYTGSMVPSQWIGSQTALGDSCQLYWNVHYILLDLFSCGIIISSDWIPVILWAGFFGSFCCFCCCFAVVFLSFFRGDWRNVMKYTGKFCWCLITPKYNTQLCIWFFVIAVSHSVCWRT